MPSRRHLAVCVAAALAAVPAAAQSLFTQGQVLLAEGDPAPGVNGAVIGGAAAIDFPVVDLAGNVLVRARFTGVGATSIDDRAYFVGRTRDTMRLLLRSGDPEPTGSLGAGVRMITQSSAVQQSCGLGGAPRLAPEGGVVMFGAGLVGPTVITSGTAANGRNDAALFWGVDGAWFVAARRGDPTGLNGTRWDTAFGANGWQATSLNAGGVMAFQATLAGGDVVGASNDAATFVGGPTTLQPAVRKGDLVPVVGGSCDVGALGANVVLNRAGWLLHDLRFGAGGATPATTADDNIVMLWRPGVGNVVVVREGAAAPLPSGAGNFGVPALASGFGQGGAFAFTTTLTGGTVTTADDNAVFLAGLAGAQLVHREGTPAPGLPGVQMGVALPTASCSDFEGGSVAFFCTLAGAGVTTANDQSLWLGRPGQLRLLAREGDPAPGFAGAPGVLAAVFGAIAPGSVLLDERGDVVCNGCAVLVTTATGVTTRACSYGWDPQHGLRLLFAAGDAFPAAAGPTPASATAGVMFQSGDGCPVGMSSVGDVVQRVDFAVGGAVVRARLGSADCKPSAIAVVAGGAQTIVLNAGPTNAADLYVLAVGGSGSRPGFVFGGAPIPLNPDVWTGLGLDFLNAGPWSGTFGVLDGQGRAVARFALPPGLLALAGADLIHALVVLDGATLAVPFAGAPCGLLLH